MNKRMKVLDLFAGIGGFSLGLERTGGFETVAFCEIEPYAQKVLSKHWPGVPIYGDVRKLTADRLASDGIGVDVITGGFPCQDISTAGKQAGLDGERSGLWSECARLLGELRPRYAIFENVRNLLNGEGGAWFKRVLWEISALGYDAEWHCIPASELGAHHHRDRVWIVVYPNEAPLKGGGLSSGIQKALSNTYGRSERWCASRDVAYPVCVGQQRPREFITPINPEAHKDWEAGQSHDECIGNLWASEPGVVRVANGVPKASHRLGCLGNAVVPQIPELIGKAILDYEEQHPVSEGPCS